MNKAMRFSSAAVGMILLAALANYQRHPDPTVGQEDILTGTALPEQVEPQAPEEALSNESQQPACDDATNRADQTASDCATEPPSSISN